MTTLLQVSDTHFGTEQPPVVAALHELAQRSRADVLVVSGDITQRARRRQFAAARRFIDRLPPSALVAIPGNHDIPLFNVFARLFRPYGNYTHAFGDVLEPEFEATDLVTIGVNTTRGDIRAKKTGIAVAGSTGRVMQLAGIDRLPIESHVLQAFVSESLKPFLDTVVTFGMGHFYMSQSDKGGLIYGGALDGYNSYAQRGNLPVVEEVMAEMLALFPGLARVRLLRSWGGTTDMSMDGSPIIACGPLPGLYLNCGWCYGGFKATPASGFCFAHTIARDEPHPLNAPFALDRFRRGILIDEKGQGATPNLH